MTRKRQPFIHTYKRHNMILTGVDKCITCGVEIHAIKTATAQVVMCETEVIDIRDTGTGKPIMIITSEGKIARGYRAAKGKGYIAGYRPHPCIKASQEKAQSKETIPDEQEKLF